MATRLSLSNLSANVVLALYDEAGSLVTWSNKWGTQDENISTFLNEGHYTSRIYSYNTSAWNNNGATAFNLNISRQADCFEQLTNDLIDDNSVKNATLNSIKFDNEFSRNDIIGILKSGKQTSPLESTTGDDGDKYESHRQLPIFARASPLQVTKLQEICSIELFEVAAVRIA